jgi:hypothetical protein
MSHDTLSFSERVELIDAIRAYHRRTRNAGFVACLLGVMTMIAGRYMAGAPMWLVDVGLGAIVFGWGLFSYALVKRSAFARAHPFDTNG